ncbi:MAG TPA: CaiB/BaiF CoA-transferase family protein [Myxococcota bacterium]|nr:CaiB/BaiF CoA-transferase family protein [Myxococcota bacterium]
MESPLSALRVLDLSRVLAGPFAARMLADLGADVVKVESPEGDITRGWGAVRNGLSGYFTQQNAGKRTVCINLEVAGGGELLQRLAERSDVLIENFRPGVLDRHGLGWERLHALNPRLVMLSISGFGTRSPEAHRPAYASVLHAEAGIVARQAEFDATRPSDPVLSIADTNAGLHGLAGVLAALLQRERTGLGQHVDIAMLEAMLVTDDYAHFVLDETPLIRGGGEIWDAPGGPIMITGDFRYIWRVLTTKLGVVDPTPPGANLAEKIHSRRKAAADFYRSFPDRAKLIEALNAGDLAWGDVRSTEAAFSSPTARARGTATVVDDRGGGTRRVVQSPYRFSGARSGVRGCAAYRGEHNREVLAEWIAALPDEITKLEEAGVLLAEKRM